MRPLPPYSGSDATCPKCGWSGPASVEYRVPGFCEGPGPHEPYYFPGDPDGPPDPGLGFSAEWQRWHSTHARPERLCRKCELCGCRWDQACLEAKPARSLQPRCACCGEDADHENPKGSGEWWCEQCVNRCPAKEDRDGERREGLPLAWPPEEPPF